MAQHRLRALLLDLDGVLRVWDRERDRHIEAEHGLPQGILAATAFAKRLLVPAITGQIDDHQWRVEVEQELVRGFSSESVAGALAAWTAYAGEVVPEVLELVREVRCHHRVGIVTNATTRLNEDLSQLGLDHELDVVINSSRIGHTKPDHEIFHHALRELSLRPHQVLFVDDDVTNVLGAEEAGLHAVRYRDPDQLRADLELSRLLPVADTSAAHPSA